MSETAGGGPEPTGDGVLRTVLRNLRSAWRALSGSVRDFEYGDMSPGAVLLHRACKTIGWVLLAVAAWYAWQTATDAFTTLVPVAPPPATIDEDLKRTALFNILALVLVGPIGAFAVYFVLKAGWVFASELIRGLLPKVFHPLSGPALALALALASVPMTPQIAAGFWGSYHWLQRTFENAADWSPTSG